MNNELVAAAIALFLAIVVSLLLKKPAEKLVKYLMSLKPAQMQTVLVVAIVGFVALLFVLSGKKIHLSASNLVVVALIVWFLRTEYLYRAKRDGVENAKGAIGTLLIVGAIAATAQYFFGLPGLAVVLLLLIVATGVVFYKRYYKSKEQ